MFVSEVVKSALEILQKALVPGRSPDEASDLVSQLTGILIEAHRSTFDLGDVAMEDLSQLRSDIDLARLLQDALEPEDKVAPEDWAARILKAIYNIEDHLAWRKTTIEVRGAAVANQLRIDHLEQLLQKGALSQETLGQDLAKKLRRVEQTACLRIDGNSLCQAINTNDPKKLRNIRSDIYLALLLRDVLDSKTQVEGKTWAETVLGTIDKIKTFLEMTIEDYLIKSENSSKNPLAKAAKRVKIECVERCLKDETFSQGRLDQDIAKKLREKEKKACLEIAKECLREAMDPETDAWNASVTFRSMGAYLEQGGLSIDVLSHIASVEAIESHRDFVATEIGRIVMENFARRHGLSEEEQGQEKDHTTGFQTAGLVTGGKKRPMPN